MRSLSNVSSSWCRERCLSMFFIMIAKLNALDLHTRCRQILVQARWHFFMLVDVSSRAYSIHQHPLFHLISALGGSCNWTSYIGLDVSTTGVELQHFVVWWMAYSRLLQSTAYWYFDGSDRSTEDIVSHIAVAFTPSYMPAQNRNNKNMLLYIV